MVKFLGVMACVVIAGLMVSACSSDADGGTADPLSACKSLASTTCEKYFNCFTAEELAAASETVGNNKADCVAKQSGQCTADSAKCDSGKTYHADKADACLSAFEAFSCTQFRGLGDSTQTPAACDQVCAM